MSKKEELDKAICDYYIDNRLIAYREPHDDIPSNIPKELREQIIEARVESFCLEHYAKDIDRIRRKYESTDSKLRKLPEGRNPRGSKTVYNEHTW